MTGRVKDIVIRAGRHIYPQEIEEAVALWRESARAASPPSAWRIRKLRDGAAGHCRRDLRDGSLAARPRLQRKFLSRGGDRRGARRMRWLLAPRATPKTLSGKLPRRGTALFQRRAGSAEPRGPGLAPDKRIWRCSGLWPAARGAARTGGRSCSLPAGGGSWSRSLFRGLSRGDILPGRAARWAAARRIAGIILRALASDHDGRTRPSARPRRRARLQSFELCRCDAARRAPAGRAGLRRQEGARRANLRGSFPPAARGAVRRAFDVPASVADAELSRRRRRRDAIWRSSRRGRSLAGRGSAASISARSRSPPRRNCRSIRASCAEPAACCAAGSGSHGARRCHWRSCPARAAGRISPPRSGCATCPRRHSRALRGAGSERADRAAAGGRQRRGPPPQPSPAAREREDEFRSSGSFRDTRGKGYPLFVLAEAVADQRRQRLYRLRGLRPGGGHGDGRACAAPSVNMPMIELPPTVRRIWRR